METIGINWNTLLGALGPSAILIWYLWHTQSVSLPKKDKDRLDEVTAMRAEFQATLDTTRKDFRETLDRVVDAFRQDLKEERSSRAAEIAEMRDSFRCQNFKPIT